MKEISIKNNESGGTYKIYVKREEDGGIAIYKNPDDQDKFVSIIGNKVYIHGDWISSEAFKVVASVIDCIDLI
ncbi:MAG: hypothetical protein GF411_08415 [Candidatus Lokiarchaeota archaeon]|nr:hypothetical protein [Candidatus Lokiarchaeota archaeon]